MQHFSTETIQSWDRFYRGNFINSLSGFKPVSLIGTVNKAGQPNLAVFSNIVHIGADPALIGFINRPLAAAPHTISNIEATGIYTINHINESIVKKAHQTSAKYDTTVNEFEAVNLTSTFKNNCLAPFVTESYVQYALQLVEIVPIKHNNTFLVIGQITDVYVSENAIEKDGLISIEKLSSMVSLGIDAYYNCQFAQRFDYAKP